MEEIKKVKLNSKHFTRILILEFLYCLVVFFCFNLIPFQKSLDIGRAINIIFIYYAIILILPTGYNILQIIKAKRSNDYGKISNHFIVEILVIFFVLWISK